MISGACELAADEKYRIAAAHYEKANRIAREEGSNASKVRSLKKAHAEMQEIVWQYPETQAAKRVLVDTRISFSAADVEQKLYVLGVKAKIEQLQPVDSMQENSGQSLAEYAIASLLGVYDQFDNRVAGLLPRLDTKPNMAGTLPVEQEPNNSTDLIQKNITSIEDDRVGTRTASGLATVALDTEEKNKVSDITTSEAHLEVTTLPNKLPNKKPDNYHLFTKQKSKDEPVEPIYLTSVASMQNTVDDGATKFFMTIGNGLDLEADENVRVEETLEAIFLDGFDDTPLLPHPINTIHSHESTGKSPLTGVQYITSDLMLAPSSPTQFIGFRHNPSTLLSSEVLDQITSELFGRPIDIALVREAIEHINQAYEVAGFKLSYALLPKQTVKNGLIEVRLFEDADLNHHF